MRTLLNHRQILGTEVVPNWFFFGSSIIHIYAHTYIYISRYTILYLEPILRSFKYEVDFMNHLSPSLSFIHICRLYIVEIWDSSKLFLTNYHTFRNSGFKMVKNCMAVPLTGALVLLPVVDCKLMLIMGGISDYFFKYLKVVPICF